MALLLLGLLLLTLSPPTSSYSHLCNGGSNSTTSAAFQSNLKLLLNSFSSTNSTFSKQSEGSDPDKIYGLALCRGDINLPDCSICLTSAAKYITQACPNYTEATVWLDDCLIRYSYTLFFTIADYYTPVTLRNKANATDADTFSKLEENLLEKLADVAAYNSSIFFATGTAVGGDLPEIYGLAQCTRDLSIDDCHLCLRQIIAGYSWCCGARLGGQVLANSCIVRSEIKPFFKGDPSISLSSPASFPPPPPAGEKSHQGTKNIAIKILRILLPIVGILMLIVVAGIWYRRRFTKHIRGEAAMDEIPTSEALLLDLSLLRAATCNFADSNKLGQGGFGTVYKGVLPNGEVIAVKRLSGSSKQGIEELKNELILVAKLQHKNLVRIRGVCLEEEEKLLVYEYMPNRSLDNILFDPVGGKQLTWERRFNIISGIARGLLYLHDEAHLKVIHRDLKASNILLDAKMNPKISDFGLARLFGEDELQQVTSRVVGTFGYMAPEYARGGQFSMKSDVYSFGILLLEIVTGKFNGSFKYDSEYAQDILSYAWGNWINNTALQIMDPSLGEDYSSNEALRCIQIALLCAQELPANRPLMATVCLMLQSPSVTLQQPSQPRYIAWMSADKSTSSSEQSAFHSNEGLARSVSSPYDDDSKIKRNVSEPKEEAKLLQGQSMTNRAHNMHTT